jgi:hypothetical protein
MPHPSERHLANQIDRIAERVLHLDLMPQGFEGGAVDCVVQILNDYAEVTAERDAYRDAKTTQMPPNQGDHTEEESARIRVRYAAACAPGAPGPERAYAQAFDEMSAVFQQARLRGSRRES